MVQTGCVVITLKPTAGGCSMMPIACRWSSIPAKDETAGTKDRQNHGHHANSSCLPKLWSILNMPCIAGPPPRSLNFPPVVRRSLGGDKWQTLGRTGRAMYRQEDGGYPTDLTDAGCRRLTCRSPRLPRWTAL
jgi:hypothetical protein